MVKFSEYLETMFYWISERQTIYYKREHLHLPPPWTDDVILRNNRFCNVFREYDRGSKYLIDRILHSGLPWEYIVFNSIFYRKFNKIKTYEFTRGLTPGKSLETLKEQIREFQKIEAPHGIAYRSDASALAPDEKDKIDKYFNQFPIIWNRIQKKKELYLGKYGADAVYKELLSYPGLGEFLAYQIFVDLSYSDQTEYNEEDLVVAGPGCKRGINLVFEDKDGMSYEKCIYYIVDHQQEFFQKFGIDPEHLFRERPVEKRRLNIMAVENIFCEISKYIKMKLYYDDPVGNKKAFKRRKFSIEPESLFD